jgi:FAD:protein FMN transferase
MSAHLPAIAEARGPGRREFVALGVGAFVVAALPFAWRRSVAVTRRTIPVMGTIADVSVLHRDVRHAEGAIDAALTELRRVESTMSRFRAASEVGTINRLGAIAPQPVSEATGAVIAAALAWAHASGGSFDPAIGRVVELWNVSHRQAPPDAPVVTRLAGRQLYRHVQLATEDGRPALFLTDPDVHLDLGGIAKGYAVDRAVDALRAWGICDAMVNVGGDLFALGSAPGGVPWRVGIQSPGEPGAIMGTLEVSDRAVATSGDYEQFFRYRGVRYHHLMDPETAAPRRASVHSVTIEAASCMDADAAATTVFGMTSDRARAVLAVRAHGARVVSWG